MMKGTYKRLRLDEPATYRIAIQGRLDNQWVTYFDGMTIAIDTSAQDTTLTTMTGLVLDQAALHGLLTRIRDLGLPLLLVERIEEEK